jgi:hypothetical protein
MKRATDHRALVLEAVATAPTRPTCAAIIIDCADTDFTPKTVRVMAWTLRRDGLLGLDEHGGYFITRAGLDYLTHARFDRKIPAPHTRPRSRKRGRV